MSKNRLILKKKEGRKHPRFYLSSDKKLMRRAVRRKLNNTKDVDEGNVTRVVRSKFEDIY